MGRRKERRLAAKSAAGRRVKLDLFAEPSGDLGGSSALEEVGGDVDSKTQAEFPSSPSSSGQQPQNPLLLLEQYSDDELDEDSNGGHGHAVAEDASIGMDEESKVAAGKEAGDLENFQGKESSNKVEQALMDDSAASQVPSQEGEKESITKTCTDDLDKQTNKTEVPTYPAAPDEHLAENVRSGWKMVLHEESNQYYYWNVLTGETSWEVPDVLAQLIVGTSAEEFIRDSEGNMDVVMGTNKSDRLLDKEEDDTTTRELNVHSKINYQISDSADQVTKMDGSDERFQSGSIEDKEGNRDANQDNGTSLLGGHSVANKSGTDLSLQLIKHCESLLVRLNSVKSLQCYLEGQDLGLKCRLEIETRLSDIKALAVHGLSLLPFWLHSEAQLKQLGTAVDSVLQQVNLASLSGFEAALESCGGTGDINEIDASEKAAGDSPEKSTLGAHIIGTTSTGYASSVVHSSAHLGNDVGGNNEITGTEKIDLNPKPAHHSLEDVDMDVDMEVEDTSSVKSPHGGMSGANYHVSTEPSNVHNTLSGQEPTLPEQVFPVPPPEKDWIPPPPPDNEPFPPPPPDDEPFPPPPPDEPPETSCPPLQLGSIQAFPYPEQYTLSYPGSGLEYYVQTNADVSGATLYAHPEGGQVALSHVPQYYEAVSNAYAVAPGIVNPVEMTTYYGLQNGTLNPASLMNNAAESSGTQSEPAREKTGIAGSLDSCPESGSNLLLKNNVDADKLSLGTDVPEAQTSVGAPATSTVANGVPVLSTSDNTTSAAAVAATKSQSKASRTKKRTVAVVSTLRSNKKVSSLVDKWKAAKEELHEEEEEPEDAYEILERKRQREIEHWRAQQIASGEAKDNANFQPLGGDWRDRVKRKRAKKMKEIEQISPDVPKDGNQQPDLLELSKTLPSGWQAYWDDSSKQIYYGNVLTSETTWTRPTD